MTDTKETERAGGSRASNAVEIPRSGLPRASITRSDSWWSYLRPRRSVFIRRLSDLAHQKFSILDQPDASDFCRLCAEHSKDETGGCCFAAQLKDVVTRLKEGVYAFVTCEKGGGKGAVIPVGPSWQDVGSVFVALGRSPLMDRNHLGETATQWGVDLEVVEEAWLKLPVFGPRFVRRVLTLLRKHFGVLVTRDVAKSLQDLGESYRLYEFDIVMFEALRRLRQKAKLNGVVAILFTSAQTEQKSEVIRVLHGPIGKPSAAVHIPIIGFGTATDGNTPCRFEDPRITNMAEAMANEWTKKFPEPHDLGILHTSYWQAKVVTYLGEKLPLDDPRLVEIRRQTENSIHRGAGTVFLKLLEELKKSDLDVKHFKEVLDEDVDFLKGSLRGDDRERLNVRVLEDLSRAIMSVKRTHLPNETRRVIREVLKFLEPYSPGTRVSRLSEYNTEELLKDSLSGKSDAYLAAVEEEVFEGSASSLRQMRLSVWVDFATALCKGLTFGIVRTAAVADYLWGSAYQRFARKHLYRDEYQ